MPLLRIDGNDVLGKYVRAMHAFEAKACNFNCDDIRRCEAELTRDPLTVIVLERLTQSAALRTVGAKCDEHGHIIPIVGDGPDDHHRVVAALRLGFKEINVRWTDRRAREAMAQAAERYGFPGGRS
ncbi:MAG TPA: hypothetical protein VFQ35_23580 [Polyangiaceae bacterium]|nr:hypothetical protein [Polyangiaceae bacterium]